MEQFVYSDIFDTKGIEYIIVILFFTLLIPFWRMLNKPGKLQEAKEGAIQALNLQALRIPQGLLFNRNHTWSHLEKSGLASVGMDDLLLHLTGGVELKLPEGAAGEGENGVNPLPGSPRRERSW